MTHPDNPPPRTSAEPGPEKKHAGERLAWHHRILLRLMAAVLFLWTRTLRFELNETMRAAKTRPPPPSVVILWHNRLIVVPEFFRRHFRDRNLAVLVSASRDGTWLAEFLRIIGMHPVRGSHYRRGAQAVRELIAENRRGRDIGITPDGSRGPMYDMKPGALAVALKTGAPIQLLSFTFHRALRLKSWDRMFIPVPFSRVKAKLESVPPRGEASDSALSSVAAELKERLDAITEDPPE